MKVKNVVTCLGLSLLLVIGGCAKGEPIENKTVNFEEIEGIDLSSNESMFTTTPSSINSTVGNLSINANVHVPEGVNSVPNLKVEMRDFGETDVYDRLSANKSFSQQTEFVGDDQIAFEDISTNTYLTWYPNELYYTDDSQMSKYDIIKYFQFYKHRYSSNDLDFATVQSAKEAVEKEAALLGLELSANPKVTSLDQTTMNAQKDEHLKGQDQYLLEDINSGYVSIKDSFTKEDEAYQLEYKLSYNGVDFTSVGLYDDLAGINFSHSGLEATYTKDGIVDLDVRGAYKVVSAYNESNTIIDLNLAIKTVNDYFNNSQGTPNRTYNVNDIYFEYMPVLIDEEKNIVEYTPVWRFNSGYEDIFVDALTGEFAFMHLYY